MDQKFKNPYRWVVLLTFTLVGGVSQMLWLNFAPLISLVQSKYGVDEMTASTLLLVYPLVYVVLSLPAGAMIDSKGYKWTIGLGTMIMMVFSVVRVFDSTFAALLIGSVGISIGQPFVLNGISKLVQDWFDENQSAMATGLGTVGLFLGMALGLALTPALVESMGLQQTMMVFSGITIISGVLFFIFTKENGVAKPSHASIGFGFGSLKEIKELIKIRDLNIVFVISLLGLGYFNGLTTWLEAILKPNGINAVDAGMIGGVLIIGGIFGAIIIPGLSDHFKLRKPFLLVCLAGAISLTFPFCVSGNYNALLVMGGILGFFFLPAYALLLEISSELAGIDRTGLATGVLMLTGNAGGVIVIIAMEVVKGDSTSWQPAIWLLLGLLAIAAILSFMIKESFSLKVPLR